MSTQDNPLNSIPAKGNEIADEQENRSTVGSFLQALETAAQHDQEVRSARGEAQAAVETPSSQTDSSKMQNADSSDMVNNTGEDLKDAPQGSADAASS